MASLAVVCSRCGIPLSSLKLQCPRCGGLPIVYQYQQAADTSDHNAGYSQQGIHGNQQLGQPPGLSETMAPPPPSHIIMQPPYLASHFPNNRHMVQREPAYGNMYPQDLHQHPHHQHQGMVFGRGGGGRGRPPSHASWEIGGQGGSDRYQSEGRGHSGGSQSREHSVWTANQQHQHQQQQHHQQHQHQQHQHQQHQQQQQQKQPGSRQEKQSDSSSTAAQSSVQEIKVVHLPKTEPPDSSQSGALEMAHSQQIPPVTVKMELGISEGISTSECKPVAVKLEGQEDASNKEKCQNNSAGKNKQRDQESSMQTNNQRKNNQPPAASTESSATSSKASLIDSGGKKGNEFVSNPSQDGTSDTHLEEGEKMDTGEDKNYSICTPPSDDLDKDKTGGNASESTSNEEQNLKTAKGASDNQSPSSSKDTTDGHRAPTDSHQSGDPTNAPEKNSEDKKQSSRKTYTSLTDSDNNRNSSTRTGDESAATNKTQTLAQVAGMEKTGHSKGGVATDSNKGISSKTFYRGSWNKDEEHGGDDDADDDEVREMAILDDPHAGQDEDTIDDPLGASDMQGDGNYYRKSEQDEDEFQPVTSRRLRRKKAKLDKNRKEENKGDYSHSSHTSSTKPTAFQVATGMGVYVHFHTIIPPEFEYGPSIDKVFVRMGGWKFGNFNYNCLEMKKERELTGGYYLLSGHIRIDPTALYHTQVPYKYILERSNGTYEWEWIHIHHSYIWNHVLSIPSQFCINEGTWHQYDEVMQLKKSKDVGTVKRWASALTSFGSYLFGKGDTDHEVSKLVHDRQLAVLTFLPKWKGFVVEGANEDVEAVDAILQVESVYLSVASPMVKNEYSPMKYWTPEGFDGAKLLLRFLSGKLASFSKTNDPEVTPTIDDIENRLISALAIMLLVGVYTLPLTDQQWGYLLDGLQLPVHLNKKECNQLMKAVGNTYASRKKDIINGLEHLCKNPKLQSAGKGNKYNWLMVLPIIHFFREESIPYIDSPMTMNYQNSKWWGLQNLGVDKITDINDQEANMLQAVLEQLAPLFAVDRLLPRSFMWLKMTPAGLQQVLQAQQFPPGLLCCALHTALSKVPTYEKEQIKKMAVNLKLLCNQVVNIGKEDTKNSEKQMPIAKCVHLANLASRLAMAAFDKATRKDFYALVSSSCELFVACYNLCFVNTPRQTRSQQSLMGNVERLASQLQNELLEWLRKRLTNFLSHDGKNLEFDEEFHVWHSLLSITYVDTTAAESWDQALYAMLKGRVKKLRDEHKLTLFGSADVTPFHGAIGKVLSEAAFEALDNLLKVKGDQGLVAKFGDWISGGLDPKKCGKLFSDVLLKAWPKPAAGEQQVNEMQLLRHVLRWTPFVNFFNIIDSDTGFGQFLTQEAQNQLALAKTIFKSVCESVQDGTVSVGQLRFITEGRCLQQYIDLYKIMASANQGSSVDQKPPTGVSKMDANVQAILRLLNTRKKELAALQHQIDLNKALVGICNTIPPVDNALITRKLRTDVNELQLNKVCQPITMQQLQVDQEGQWIQPNITFFSHSVAVQSMLQRLNDVQTCRVFKKLFKAQALDVRKSRVNNLLSIEDVYAQVFRPVYSIQLVEVVTKLHTETITLGDVDYHFSDIKDRTDILQKELQMLSKLKPDLGVTWVVRRLRQIQDYYRIQHQAQAAGELLKIRTAFELKGDFEPMEILNNVNSQAFKKRPLQHINQDVIQAATKLTNVGQKEVDCLRELAQCKELINWVKQEITDVQELKVFVDLAMISAGETDIEVDRVSCFHRAATGYAPFIFELKDSAGYSELIDMTKKVWKALENDHDLPKKLRDTQRQLFWLKEVKDSQGSVETSSLSQAEAINAGGVYTVGNLHEKGNSTATLKLKVTLREMTVDEDEEDDERVYTLEMLRDLQSRLTLVAGKTQEDKQGLQAHVEDFVGVFTAAQQLASTYSKLCLAGCILFKEWKAILYCGKDLGEVSVHVDFGATKLLGGTRPLMIELNFLREFMDNCLSEWHRYVDEQRSSCYELNYFTTEQLVFLRQYLAQYGNIRELPAQKKQKKWILRPMLITRYFQAGGMPEQVVVLLSENYTAVAQTVNLFAEWLIFTGVPPTEVQQIVEKHLKTLIIKHFDPKKADSIFVEEGGTPAWLESMIQHRTWRALFYQLAEDYPDCLMLNFTIKLISDAGYQGEIGNVSTACHEIEVFSKVMQTSITKLLEGGEEAMIKHLPEFSKMVCHGQHTFLYAQVLMHLLTKADSKHEGGMSIIRRLCQEVQQAGKERGEGVTQVSLAISQAAAYPRACQALVSMISRKALNPADITVLFKMFSTDDPPSAELIRIPQFLDLFLQSLFKPGSTINPDHRHKYTFLLAYAVCVHETWKKGKRTSLTKDEVKPTQQAIEKVHAICADKKVGSELIAELQSVYQCIRYPIVGIGVLYWIEKTVTEPSYFQRITDHTPLHLLLMDEVVNCHPLIHTNVLELLIKLFEDPYPQLDVMLQMELKKTILDRMVHLLSRNFVVPVVQYIAKCVQKQDTDISLIRHFVTEVLDMIAPPYTSEFVHLFLPILENNDITGNLKSEDGKDPVSQFIVHCKTNFIMMS